MLKLPLPEVHATPRIGDKFTLGIDLQSPELLPREATIGYRAFSFKSGMGVHILVGPLSLSFYVKKTPLGYPTKR